MCCGRMGGKTTGDFTHRGKKVQPTLVLYRLVGDRQRSSVETSVNGLSAARWR